MPIPHIYRRSARRQRQPYQEPTNEQATARLISAQLGHMIDKTDGAKLTMLSYLLECARIEAERVVAG